MTETGITVPDPSVESQTDQWTRVSVEEIIQEFVEAEKNPYKRDPRGLTIGHKLAERFPSPDSIDEITGKPYAIAGSLSLSDIPLEHVQVWSGFYPFGLDATREEFPISDQTTALGVAEAFFDLPDDPADFDPSNIQFKDDVAKVMPDELKEWLGRIPEMVEKIANGEWDFPPIDLLDASPETKFKRLESGKVAPECDFDSSVPPEERVMSLGGHAIDGSGRLIALAILKKYKVDVQVPIRLLRIDPRALRVTNAVLNGLRRVSYPGRRGSRKPVYDHRKFMKRRFDGPGPLVVF